MTIIETALSYPTELQYSGYTDGSRGTIGGRDSGGWFWVPRAISSIAANGLDIRAAGFNPQTFTSKKTGYDVRCVAKAYLDWQV